MMLTFATWVADLSARGHTVLAATHAVPIQLWLREPGEPGSVLHFLARGTTVTLRRYAPTDLTTLLLRSECDCEEHRTAGAGTRTVLIGGQNAVNAKGEIVGKGDFARQTEQALKNLVTCLDAVGADVSDLIQVKIYIKAGEDLRAGFGEWMKVWGQRSNPPLVTGLFVSALANPDYLIEIEGTAALPA